MRRRNSMIALVAVGLAVVLGVLVPASALIPGTAPRLHVPEPRRGEAVTLSWLSTSGDRIVDEQGRTILLRGFNTTVLLDWPEQPAAPLDDDDLNLIARSGFNVIRLPIAWSRLEPRRGQIDMDYLDAIASTVERINQHNLYVVLDLHVTLAWSPRFGGAGAPGWATLPLVPEVRWGKSGDWTEAASPAVLASNAYFWLSPDWQSDVSLVWRAVAARFRNVSGVAGYDMYNEPNSAPLVKFTTEVSPGGRFLVLKTMPPTAASQGATWQLLVKFHLAMNGLIAAAYCALPLYQNSLRGMTSTSISNEPRRKLLPCSLVSTRPKRTPASSVCALGVLANDVLPPRKTPFVHTG